MNDLQSFQFLSKYSRWNGERRETFDEAIDRTLFWLFDEIASVTGYRVALEETGDLWYAMRKMQSFPSLRLFQMAGPALDRCNVGLYNCSAIAIDSIQSFSELMYNSMQGTGVGFSVEKQFIDQLPEVRKKGLLKLARPWVIPDTTEGWCDALALGLRLWTFGRDVEFDYSLIRPAGSRLATKGGFASGPEPLRSLLDFVRSICLRYWTVGGRLSPYDAHSICCKIGEIVVVGGVRRSALIGLSDLADTQIRDCKSRDWYSSSPWLSQANNSAVYTERPTSSEFWTEWNALRASGSGERGIFNRYSANLLSGDRDQWDFLCNPCAEIHLRSGQFCNLSRAICRPTDMVKNLERKVVLATIFGTLQSSLTHFNYLRDFWRINCEEERLLGVTLDGALDCPLLRPGSSGRRDLLCSLRRIAVETNIEWASKLGIGPSKAITCMQPGGNGPLLFNTASGLHCRYAPYYMRRFRSSSMDPLTVMLKDQGVRWYPENGQSEECHSVCVFEFPVRSPDGVPTRHSLSALEQFSNWLDFKLHWTDHNPSVTIYVKENEWDDLGREVLRQFDSVGGLSFLPVDGGQYALTPYLEITKEEYEEVVRRSPVINWKALPSYEKSDMKIDMSGPECVGPTCALG